ncbi:hypothetical protein DNU06_14880 [Putridiphycobacter roseus]|uniref:Uncharacterized protein n=1 Tax=Putridiphycobacter roseus TaxID=2219161 RepID=A0A2W1MVG0_9FLAO|nr:hypothetical protein [Putridiphycobacter roseus]PZE16079.1 hypothetical protein DNU06_14880 [Putridiphycobacter roseus]
MDKLPLKKERRRRYVLEFLSIFIAVISAFALNNWNDYRKNVHAESKILREINNGLSKDLQDLKLNVKGHQVGLRACKVWNQILVKGTYTGDSIQEHYLNLTRDFINVQNVAGYSTLKSKGLEVVRNDKLRQEIISLYEYDYNTLRKLEEEYEEMQFQKSYFNTINSMLAPQLKFNNAGRIISIQQPFSISVGDHQIMRSILLKIYSNRLFILQYYQQLEYRLKHLQNSIQFELGI